MLIDYNVRDDWPDQTPTWLKSLVSSLHRRSAGSLTLPLTVSVQEMLDWIELASGEDAWTNRLNRRSLWADFEQSIGTTGASLRALLSPEVSAFRAAFGALDGSKRDPAGATILAQPPGSRTHQHWIDLDATSRALLNKLESDPAVAANWHDLVDVSTSKAPPDVEYRPLADLLHDQLRRRNHDATATLDHVRDLLAYGRESTDVRWGDTSLSLTERLSRSEAILLDLAAEGDIVVWLGYRGGRVNHAVNAGPVTFMDARWFIPNAREDGQPFDHKSELTQIVDSQLLTYPESIADRPSTDLLVRVDLGRRPVFGAAERAESVATALISVAVHESNGVRPLLGQSFVLRDGRLGGASIQATKSAIEDDPFGNTIAANAIDSVAPKLGAALATGTMPRYLAAALAAQTAADLPLSRERLLQPAQDHEYRMTIPLEDRVVQQVAAYAGIGPNKLFELLARSWADSRWRADVERAVYTCLLGGGEHAQERSLLLRQLHQTSEQSPWLAWVADNESDLLRICRVESERRWIERIFRSISDKATYTELIAEYEALNEVLALRRARSRNALVRGNPVSTEAVRSVRGYASYLSRYALQTGLDAFGTSRDLVSFLDRDYDETTDLLTATSVAEFWRQRAADADTAAPN